MRGKTGSIAFFLSIFLLYGCFTAPEYPIIPNIGYEDIAFKEVPNLQDSLILTINFTDGDGDLGLFPDENNAPYNSLFVFEKEDGRLLTLGDRANPPYDTLPPYEFPYYCQNYLTPLEHNLDAYENDTIYVERNENRNNIFVEFFVRKNGQYTEFDWETDLGTDCTDSFDGRFPVLGDLSGNRPLEGTLRYGMISAGFLGIFRNDTIKLRVRIKDRALHDSNVIETPDFVLRDIQVE